METDTDSDTNWENSAFAKRKIRSPVLRAKNSKNESANVYVNLEGTLSQQKRESEKLTSSPDKCNSSFDSGLGHSETFYTGESSGKTYQLKLKEAQKKHDSVEHEGYDSTDSENENSRIECLVLHRLPGEKLGMILGVEGEKTDREKVKAVRVRSVTIGGAAERASGGSRGVGVSDEILEINGLDLHTLTYDECVTVFREMPLQVFMLIKRSKTNIQNLSENEGIKDIEAILSSPPKGFTFHTVTIQKKHKEALGLSIVPSYGSTKHFYQVKRLLASGPSARNCQLCVGDRLLSYNNTSLQNLVQSECMSILKQRNEKVTFRILRPTSSGQRLRISVNKSSRKEVSWYSSGLDSTPETTDSETEANIPSSEDNGVEFRGFHLHSSGARHLPQVNEVFSNRQFKIAYTEPALDSHVTSVPDTSIGFKRPAPKRDIHHFHPHGLSKSLKMDDSNGEKQDRTDALNLFSSDMDWLDSLNSAKSSEHVKVEAKSDHFTSNGTAPLVDFGDDLVKLEPQKPKETDGIRATQLPPPAAFADMSNPTSEDMANQNGYKDIWESGVYETEYISEADNDVPVTNIDDLLDKSQQSNHYSNTSDNDSELFSLNTESTATDNLMEFEHLQSSMVANRVFYQPPQEISSGYNRESNFGDLLGSNPESEVEHILSVRMAGANERDEEECLSTFSSHSGSTVIHRTGSALEDMGDGCREAVPDNVVEAQDGNINNNESESHQRANISVTTVYAESQKQDTLSASGITQEPQWEHLNLGSVPVTEKTVPISVSTEESSAPVDASDNDINNGEVVSLYIEEPIKDKHPLPCEPCIVEEHIVQAETCPQVEATSSQLLDSPTEYEEPDIIPVRATRDVVIKLDGATDIQISQNSDPDKSVLPELVENLVDVCKADDEKATGIEESNVASTVEEKLIVPSDKSQTSLLMADVSGEKEQSGEQNSRVQSCSHKQSKEEDIVSATQGPSIGRQGDNDTFAETEDSIVSKQENTSLMNQPNTSDIIIPVKAPRRSPTSDKPCINNELEKENGKALPRLVDSMVQNLEQSEKYGAFKDSDQNQNRKAANEEKIVPAEISREQAQEPTEQISKSDTSINVQYQNEETKFEEIVLTANTPAHSQPSTANIPAHSQPSTANIPAYSQPSDGRDTDSGIRHLVSIEQPNKGRKSKLENPDEIVPVKVPRHSVNTDLPIGDVESEQRRKEAFPHLVDSMVHHLTESDKNVLHTREQPEHDLVIQDEKIVPAEISRESASMKMNFQPETERNQATVVSPVVDETMVEVTMSTEMSESIERSVKLNGEAETTSSFCPFQNTPNDTCLHVSMNPNSDIDLEHNSNIVERTSSKLVNANKLPSNGRTSEAFYENIIPKKAPRRVPKTEYSTNENEKEEKMSNQPFVDHLVSHLNSSGKVFQNDVNSTDSKDLAKEDTIFPMIKSVEENSVTVGDVKEVVVSSIVTEEKTKSAPEVKPEVVVIPEALAVTAIKEVTQDKDISLVDMTSRKSERLKTSSDSFGGSLIQSPKESSLTAPHVESNSAGNRKSLNLPPALAPVPDQPVTRRLPSIKAFTAKGFTPVKLNSLGTSSVIKTVSLDRSKMNRLSGVNIQPVAAPSMKLASINSRSDEGPFQIDILSGILGLGIKLTGTSDGFSQVSEIQKNSAVEKNGHIRVGDYVLCINGREITGLSDAKVQQILRLLPRGIVKLVASTRPVDKENATTASSDMVSVKPKDALVHTEKLVDNRSEAVKTSKRDGDIIAPAKSDELSAAPEEYVIANRSPAFPTPSLTAKQQSTFPVHGSSVVNQAPDTFDSSVSNQETFSIRKLEAIHVERERTASDAKEKTQPPPVKPRKRDKASEDLSLNVELARKEAVEQQSKQQEPIGSLKVTAYPVMVRPSASPRTSITSPKGPPPPVLPRISRHSRDTSGSETSKITSPQLSPRTEPRDELDSNRKPSSVAKQFGTVKSPMSKKMSGLIDKFRHEDISPVSPESDKVFSPRLKFDNQSSFAEPRKHFSFSVSEETKSETKTCVSPKSPPRVAPKPKRRSGEINYRPNISESAASEESSNDPKAHPLSYASNVEKREESGSGGLKLTTRPHSVETVFNTRSLVSTSSLTRLKGLQIPPKSDEISEDSQTTSTLQINPSKLAPALRPRSGPAAFTRVQPKIHQVTPKLNIKPIKLRTDGSDNSANKQTAGTSAAVDNSRVKDINITSHSGHNETSVTDVSIVHTDIAETAMSEKQKEKSSSSTDNPSTEINTKEWSVVTKIKSPDVTEKALVAEESSREDATESGSFVTAVPVIVGMDDDRTVELAISENLLKDQNNISSSSYGSLENDNKNNNATLCHATVSNSEATTHISLTTEDESDKVQPELPVLEKFAETVSTSVIDSSLIVASDLISTDQDLEDTYDEKQSITKAMPSEQISESVVVETNLAASDFHEALPYVSQEASFSVSVALDTPSEKHPENSDKVITCGEVTPIEMHSFSSSRPTGPDSTVTVNAAGVTVNDADQQVDRMQSPTVTDFSSRPEISTFSSTNQAAASEPSRSALVVQQTNTEDRINESAVESVDAAEPITEFSSETHGLTQETHDSDTDIPPTLPSSAPPPLPSSPPPDFVSSISNSAFQLEQTVVDSVKPTPPLALRRHQESSHWPTPTSLPVSVDLELEHSTQQPQLVEVQESSKIQEPQSSILPVETQLILIQEPSSEVSSIEKEDTSKAQTVPLSNREAYSEQNGQKSSFMTKEEQETTESILEINAVDNAESVPDRDSYSSAEPVEQSVQKDITITLQSTQTLIPDINGSVSTDNSSDSTSTDVSTVPILDLDSSTQNPTTVTNVTQRKVTVSSQKHKLNADTPLLPDDELSLLLNKANEALETTSAMVTDNEILVILLHKDIGEKVGLSFKNGSKQEILVSDIDVNSAAGKEGHIQVNDQLLLINGKTVDDRTPHDARVMLRTSRERLVLVLARSPSRVALDKLSEEAREGKRRSTSRERRRLASAESSQLQHQSSPEKPVSTSPDPGTVRARPARSSLSPEKESVGTGSDVETDVSCLGTLEVTMSKGVTGLGFCLEGGTGSPLGDKPILIKRLFKGGAADKCGLLREKDEILEVNGKSFQGLRHYEAWNYLKFLPSGDVKLIIRR